MSESKRLRRPSPEEDAAINRGIAADPDTWVPSDEEWACMKPLSEVDPELFRQLTQKGRPRVVKPTSSGPAGKRRSR
jgi:hypothetical protein